MKKYIGLYSFLFSLLASYTSMAQVTTTAKPDNKSLLWRISGKQMNQPSYLFGTMHLVCPDDYVWTNAMKECLAKADQVCFEMDLDDPTVMMQVAAGMIDHSGKHLKDYFTPAQYQKVTAYLQDSLNLNISMLESVKPAAVQSLFSMKTSRCDNTVSYEENIMQEAQQQHKEIKGLEVPAEQLALLDSLPVDSVIKSVLDAINNTSTDEQTEYNNLVIAYKHQDLPALYEIIQKSKNGGDDLNAFLDERNKKWIERMVDMMDQKSLFFAVGAGHLWGSNGVISLLRKEGFTVVPVK